MYCISIPLWGHISFCERFSVFKGIIYPLIGKSSERSFYSLIDYRSIESKTKRTVHYWTALCLIILFCFEYLWVVRNLWWLKPWWFLWFSTSSHLFHCISYFLFFLTASTCQQYDWYPSFDVSFLLNHLGDIGKLLLHFLQVL